MKTEVVEGVDGKFRVYGRVHYERVFASAQPFFLKGEYEMLWVPLGVHDTLDSATEQAILLKDT